MTDTYTPEMYRLPFPQQCPACTGKLVISPPHLLCVNDACPGVLRGRVEAFGDRDHLDIQGLGESMAVSLVDSRMVTNLADLWRLKQAHVEELPFGKGKVGAKRASSLIKAIGETNRHPWPVVLHALAVGTGLGRPQSEQIAMRYSLNDLLNVMHPVALKLELPRIEGIAEKTANDFVTWLQQNSLWLYEFVENGWLQTQYVITETGPKPLEGQQFILTGGFSDRTMRSKYEKQLESLGAKIGSKPTKKTTEVIAGASGAAQDKLDAAVKLGMTVRDEAWLVEFLKGVQ